MSQAPHAPESSMALELVSVRPLAGRTRQRTAKSRSAPRWVRLRDLVRELVTRDLKLRYKGSILGQAWTLLNPVAELLVLLFVFSTVLHLNIPNYAAFLFTGLLVYGWFQQSLYYATGAIVNNRELIRQPNVPSAILPVVTVASTLLHFALSLPVLAVLLLATGVHVTGAVLLLPALIALQFALTLALAYLLAALHVWFRDTQYLLRVALQLLFYLTPVFYEIGTVPPQFRRLYAVNPMVFVLEAYRDVLIRGRLPEAQPLLLIALTSAVLVIAGLAVFRRTGHRFADEL